MSLNPAALTIARERAHLTGRGLAELVARRLGDPSRKRALSMSYSRVERGVSDAMHADAVAATAAELGLDERDLSAPVLWAFRSSLDGRPIQLGLALPVFATRDEALVGAGFLAGNRRLPDEARGLIFADDPQPFFASDRDRWLEANFDQLDDREREFVVTVDPDEREMRSLWYAHLVTVHDKAEVRQRALAGLAELADAGTLPAVDFATLADIARRRLECDRLRDAPAPLYDRWKAEAEHLAEAATRTGAMS